MYSRLRSPPTVESARKNISFLESAQEKSATLQSVASPRSASKFYGRSADKSRNYGRIQGLFSHGRNET